LDDGELVRFRGAEIRLEMKLDHRRPMPIPDAVLYDAGDIARIDGKELAADGRLGDSGLDVVGDAVELPSQRIGDHRDRFGAADMADVGALGFAFGLLPAGP